MKDRVIIRMGASRHDVTVRGADGKPVTFDLFRMDREQRRNFHREFMNAFRQGSKA
jgi:hypothetical protein